MQFYIKPVPDRKCFDAVRDNGVGRFQILYVKVLDFILNLSVAADINGKRYAVALPLFMETILMIDPLYMSLNRRDCGAAYRLRWIVIVSYNRAFRTVGI